MTSPDFDDVKPLPDPPKSASEPREVFAYSQDFRQSGFDFSPHPISADAVVEEVTGDPKGLSVAEYAASFQADLIPELPIEESLQESGTTVPVEKVNTPLKALARSLPTSSDLQMPGQNEPPAEQ